MGSTCVGQPSKMKKKKDKIAKNNHDDEKEEEEQELMDTSEPIIQTFKPLSKHVLRKRIVAEDEFIKNLLSLIHIPKHKGQHDDSDSDVEDVSPETKANLFRNVNRTQNVLELQDRLQKKMNELKEKSSQRHPKKKLTKVEKRALLKEKEKKKRTSSIISKDKEHKNSGGKPLSSAKPVYNSEGKMVFSKFDFSEESNNKDKSKLDPKAALKKLQSHKEKIETLKEIGKTERVKTLEDKKLWKNVLDKAEGAKVKDDESLLKKSIKRLEHRKKSTKKKWDSLKASEDNRISLKQKKRSENLSKRKSEKKQNKLKKAVKKGRSIPGF